jgi:hypothetical protein
LAAFQTFTYGRLWVFTEEKALKAARSYGAIAPEVEHVIVTFCAVVYVPGDGEN